MTHTHMGEYFWSMHGWCDLCCSYFRTEILAGFVNGLFLFFVAFFIFAEAVEVIKELYLYWPVCIPVVLLLAII